jgi:hypothetical protein
MLLFTELALCNHNAKFSEEIRQTPCKIGGGKWVGPIWNGNISRASPLRRTGSRQLNAIKHLLDGRVNRIGKSELAGRDQVCGEAHP